MSIIGEISGRTPGPSADAAGSISPGFLEAQRVLPGLVQAIRLLGEHKGKEALYLQQTPQVLEALRECALMQSTESSNRLEGVTASPPSDPGAGGGESDPDEPARAGDVPPPLSTTSPSRGYAIGYPFGRSVDQTGMVQLDSRNGVGGVTPDLRVPKTLENVLAYAAGTDVELRYAVEYLRGR